MKALHYAVVFTAISFAAVIPAHIFAQNVDFVKPIDTVRINKKETIKYALNIKCNGCNAPNKAIVKPITGPFPETGFRLISASDTLEIPADKAKDIDLYLTMDTATANYGKYIGFEISNVTANTADKGKRHCFIYILPAKEAAPKNENGYAPDSMRYRYMLGTNFDFIDGKIPLSFYNHLQIFHPTGFTKRFGFVGGLLQNRLVSETKVKAVFREQPGPFADSIILSKYTKPTDSTYRIVRLDSVKQKQVSTATVFQIYFEPVFKLYEHGTYANPQTSLYIFGHADIQYHITKLTTSYTYKVNDTITVRRSSFSKYAQVGDGETDTTIKTFQYYYGCGLMLHHQNDYVDLYAKFTIGGAHLSGSDWASYYGMELGIRQPVYNFMLGAEYRGLFREHNATYFNVYLSKVFSLSKFYDTLLK